MRIKSLLVTLLSILILTAVIVFIVFKFNRPQFDKLKSTITDSISSVSSDSAGSGNASLSAQEQKIQKSINKISQGEVSLAKTFNAPELPNNLVGLVLKSTKDADKKMVAFYDSNSKNLLFPNNFGFGLFDKNGKEVITKYLKKYSKQPKLTNIKKLSDNFLSDVKKVHVVTQGSPDAKKHLIAIIDPNCPWCHREFDNLQPYIKSKKLSVDWIIVGILNKDSMKKSAEILSAKDPLQALIFNETGFNEEEEQGSINESKYPVNKAGAEAADINRKFFIAQNFEAVPLVIYEDKDGNAIAHLSYIDPSKLDSFISAIPDKS